MLCPSSITMSAMPPHRPVVVVQTGVREQGYEAEVYGDHDWPLEQHHRWRNAAATFAAAPPLRLCPGWLSVRPEAKDVLLLCAIDKD